MKVYEIIDNEEKLSVGCLLYFEREKSFVIELQEYLDEWNAPLLFANSVKKGMYTFGRDLAYLWVSGRIVPRDRQNIDSILANAKMNSYDEMLILEKSGGKCSQDSMYIKKLDAVPQYVQNRWQHNLTECVPCDDYSLLCFFADGMLRKVKLSDLASHREVSKLASSDAVFKSAHIAVGGYCVTFNDSIDIDAGTLYANGTELPLDLSDFISFAGRNLLDTSECCAVLNCSRQNLRNYISKDLLVPVKKDVRGNLYTKGDLYRLD